MKVLIALCMCVAITVFAAPPAKAPDPLQPPILDKPIAPGNTVTGKTANTKYQIIVKVFGDSGDVKQLPAGMDPASNRFYVVLNDSLKAKQIVQAFLVVNGKETAASVPVLVDGPPAVPDTTAVATPPADPCAKLPTDTSLPQPSIGPLAADDTEIKGASAFLSGNVSVCVNGTSVKVKDSATGTAAASIPFKNGSYEAFVDAGQLKEGNGVVVVITNGNRRLTNSVVVGASAKLPADACTTPDSQLSSALSPIKLHPALEDGALAVIGVAPLPKGTVVACLKGKALTQIGQVDDQGAFTLNVTDSVTQGKTIDVFVTSADNKTRTKTSVEVAPVKFTEVELSATPKEGQKTIYVNASPTGTVHYSLSAFVNGEQARIIDGSGNETDSVPTSTTGATAIQLKDPLDGGQCVQVVEFETGKRVLPDRSLLGCAATDHAVEKNYAVSRSTPTVAFFDFGRIRSYFVAGSLLSFDGGSFSQPSVFLALNANRNWIWGGMTPVTKDAGIEQTGHRFMFDTFFEARLTTVPVAVGATPTLQSTLTSPKAGELVGGVSAPIIVATWSHGKDPYGFTVGPIAKVGFLTPVGSTTGATVTPQSFYTNYGFGTRLGFQKLTYSSNIAPETISYIDVVSGRFSNFDLNHMRPWRFAFEGLLKVPSTPLFVGFSANIHQNFGLGKGNPASNARDDLRFLFGAKFDAGKLFDAIGQIK